MFDASLFFPILASSVLIIGLGALIGAGPARKLIQVREAKRDLKRGSASFIRGIAGWSLIALWLAAIWYGGTIIGDWAVTGDLEGAAERSLLRLRILIEILAVILSETD
ncbi:MAG: hypothetical protein AAF618_09705 [Pseudomonadota bacterium]